MNTPAHMALGLALLGRRASRAEWVAIAAGALLPDVILFLRFGLDGWRNEATLRLLTDVFNSAPVYAAILVAGVLARRRWLVLLAASALLHVAFDLPLHAGDARAHFWPFTDWRYASPVSFWDHDHHGRIVGLLEGVLFAVCLGVIWRNVRAWWARALCLAFAAVYAVTFVHFVGHAFFDRHWARW